MPTKKPAAAPPKPPKKKALTGTETVDAFMAALDHPFKAEVQAVREIIKGVHPGITEQIKWRAPSFSYKGYLVTFNLWEQKRVHLVFHNAAILNDTSGFLEGDYVDRRMAYFQDLADVEANKGKLVRVIRAWIERRDAEETNA